MTTQTAYFNFEPADFRVPCGGFNIVAGDNW